MYKIGIVGSRARALCFMAAGFSVYEAEDADAASVQLKHAADDGCAIIFITAEYASFLEEAISRYSGSVTPAVTVLPQAGGGAGVKLLSGAVTRAVGSDIIFHSKQD